MSVPPVDECEQSFIILSGPDSKNLLTKDVGIRLDEDEPVTLVITR